MTKRTFQRLALLFLAANSKFSHEAGWVWSNELKEKVSAITSIAQQLQLLDEETEPPP